MIIDCRSKDFIPGRDSCRVFVDGKEIQKAFYVDTDAGFVRTYAITEEAALICSHDITPELREIGMREGWDMPIGGPISKTVRGVVELVPNGPKKELL